MGPEEKARIKDEMIKHLKQLVENLEKENSKLSEEIKKKRRIECTNGCGKYSKPVDEIVEAASKHREKLVSLKQIADDQKVKISVLRDEKTVLLDQVEQLEFDAKIQAEAVSRINTENIVLKNEIRDIKTELYEKEDRINGHLDQMETIDLLKKELKDFQDEMEIKDQKIFNLRETLDKKKPSDEIPSNFVLEKENCKVNVDSLKEEIKNLTEKKVSEKLERREQFQRMDSLLKERKINLESLQLKIQELGQRKLKKCWFGIKCFRRFCNFDHSNIFRKDNMKFHSTVTENNSKLNENIDIDYLCEHCGLVSFNFAAHDKHILSNHQENVKQKFPCQECSQQFEIRCELNFHASQNHKDIEVECEVCGRNFNTIRELSDHIRRVHKPLNDEFASNLSSKLQGLISNESYRKSNNEKDKVSTFQCDKCQEICITKTSLKKHRKRLHKIYKEHFEEESGNIELKTPTQNDELNCPSNFECGMCEINFNCIEYMNDHMDDKHGGRWKIGDADVVYEGDDFEESFSTECTDTEFSDTEDSETQSGEVST